MVVQLALIPAFSEHRIMSSATPCPFCNLAKERPWLSNDAGIAFFDGHPMKRMGVINFPPDDPQLDPREEA